MTSRNPERHLAPHERATIVKALRLAVTCREGGVFLGWLQDPAYGADWRAAVLATTLGHEGRPLTDASEATWEAVAIIVTALEPRLAETPPAVVHLDPS